MERGAVILILLAVIQATCGQTVDLDSPPAVERGSNTAFTCTATGGTSRIFLWEDVSGNNNIFNGGTEAYPVDSTKYANFNLSEAGDTSIMAIWNTQIEDDGLYRCSIGQSRSEGELSVEVPYTLELSVASPLVNGMMYEATCDALNGRPEVTITWMLGNSGSPCTPVVTPLTADEQGLFSKSSECTFQADSANDGDTLSCMIRGHNVAGLDRENTTTLVVHSAPRTGIMTVGFQLQDPDLRVSCIIADADQPNPIITNYYIYNDTFLIHQSSTGVNFVDVAPPNFATDFYCEAGNYLGNITSPVATYDPDGTTTPSPPTESSSTEGPSPSPTDAEAAAALSVGEIVGIVIGAILGVIIIVLVIYFVWKKGNPGSTAASSTKKHGSSAVGTSNGSEKDKIKPVAAPRDQGSIQHTTDNPGQAEYAMVDRKKPGGGDMPDTRGPGQKEPPQGMLYADLDLSASAGHTEKKVPQNKDDVVVYSSILV